MRRPGTQRRLTSDKGPDSSKRVIKPCVIFGIRRNKASVRGSDNSRGVSGWWKKDKYGHSAMCPE